MSLLPERVRHRPDGRQAGRPSPDATQRRCSLLHAAWGEHRAVARCAPSPVDEDRSSPCREAGRRHPVGERSSACVRPGCRPVGDRSSFGRRATAQRREVHDGNAGPNGRDDDPSGTARFRPFRRDAARPEWPRAGLTPRGLGGRAASLPRRACRRTVRAPHRCRWPEDPARSSGSRSQVGYRDRRPPGSSAARRHHPGQAA